MSRLFILSELYYPDESATGYILTRIAEGLADSNSICVLTRRIDRKTARVEPTEIRHNVSIERIFGTTFNKNVFVLRAINILTFSISLFLKSVVRIRKDDKVLVVTNPPFLPFAAAFASHIRRAKCYLIVHDVYPDALVAAGLFKQSNPIIKFLDVVHKKLLRRMERIIVLGRDMKELLSRKEKSISDKIFLVPNWADAHEIRPMKREENFHLTGRNLLQKFIVQYSGNMGRTHGIENLIESATILREESRIHFLFAGSGAKREWLEQQTQKRGLSNVTVLSSQRRDRLSELLSACDIAVIPLINHMAGISVPSRIYNILAAGKPILAVAEENSELGLMIKEEEVGWVVSPGNPRLLADKILEISQEEILLASMGNRARIIAETKYSYERTIRLFREVLFPKD